MLAQPITKSLHLPSLTIEGFRGIKSLSIPRLGRVTLLSGMNGVGKSTVLEAVQLYATRGHPGVIGNVLRERDELISIIDDDGEEGIRAGCGISFLWEASFVGFSHIDRRA